MSKPVWLEQAEKYVGLEEIKGPKHNAQILSWWKKIKQSFVDDETAWCAAFVGGVLEEVGITSTRSAGARSYNKWGQELDGPAIGCVVAFWRGSPTGWSGHVGFVVGKNAKGNIMVLGGNQGDKVSVAAFDTARVLSYRWPHGHPLPTTGLNRLPTLALNGPLSTNEA